MGCAQVMNQDAIKLRYSCWTPEQHGSNEDGADCCSPLHAVAELLLLALCCRVADFSQGLVSRLPPPHENVLTLYDNLESSAAQFADVSCHCLHPCKEPSVNCNARFTAGPTKAGHPLAFFGDACLHLDAESLSGPAPRGQKRKPRALPVDDLCPGKQRIGCPVSCPSC